MSTLEITNVYSAMVDILPLVVPERRMTGIFDTTGLGMRKQFNLVSLKPVATDRALVVFAAAALSVMTVLGLCLWKLLLLPSFSIESLDKSWTRRDTLAKARQADD